MGLYMVLEINSTWKIETSESDLNGVFRIIEVRADLDCLILFELNETVGTCRPITVHLPTFITWNKEGRAIQIDITPPAFLLVSDEEIEPKNLERRNSNYEKIRSLVSDKQFILDYACSKRTSKLAQHAKQIGYDRKSLSRLLSRYWHFGQSKNALLPAYANSGGYGKPRIAKETPLGAPRTSRTLMFERAPKYIIREADKKNILKTLKKYYLKPNGKYLTECYRDYLRQFHADEVKIADACDRAPHIPSYKQFKYWKGKLVEKNMEVRLRNTDHNYNLKKRALLESPLQDGLVPGSCFEVDATVADINIISEFSPRYVLGRPTVYYIIDCATRMITGMHVSLYHASWRAARQAFVNCFTPKAEFCAQYGVNIYESEWPCSHVPAYFTCDNGEMIGLEPGEKITPFAELSFAPAYRPDYKSFVERRFKTINDKLLHQLIGTTRGGKVVRGDVDPRKESIYTLYEVTSMLIEAVLEHNRDILSKLVFDNPILVEKNIKPTPINTWKVYLANHRHSLHQVSFSEAIAKLLPPETASMTRSGIQFKEMYYTCKKIEDENLAAIAREGGRWSLDARIDDNTLNYIYVRMNNNEGFTKCTLLKRNSIFKDMPMAEVDFVQDWITKFEELSPVTVESIDMKTRHEALETQAKKRAKQSTLTRSERIRNIRENRREELRKTTHSEIDAEISNTSDDVDTKSMQQNVVMLPRRNRK
ncbi:DDE-type integrase/transposase/recombinase [Pseudoalteromonas maricaloris]